jgi:uncharacterized protein YndB with AHSA1/START domain
MTSKMTTLTRSITIDAPVSAVFEYALDPGRLWKVKDVALTDIDIKPEGVGTSARMFTHVLAFHLEGGIEYVEVVPNKRIVAQVHFFAEKPRWTFTFAATGERTKVTATGTWTVKVPVVGKPIEQTMVKEHEPMLEALLANLKTQVEGRAAA